MQIGQQTMRAEGQEVGGTTEIMVTSTLREQLAPMELHILRATLLVLL